MSSFEPGIESKVIAMFKEFVVKGETRISINGEKSQPYAGNVGVQEGAVESPALFNIFVNDLTSFIQQKGGKGVRVNEDGEYVLGCMFADDIALSDNREDMQKCLDALTKFCELWRLSISVGKTKMMVVGKEENEVLLPLFR
jgi:hypothetical protein